MKIRRNILLFKLYYLLGDLWPLSALAVVYFYQISGSYTFALGVFSVANIIQSLSEVPTGILSDRIGRRKTMILSSFLFLLSFIAFALAGTMFPKLLLLAGATTWGVACAVSSGTDDAFMYETMQELRKADKYDILYARSKAFGQIGLATGAVIAAFVTYFWSLAVLAWVSVVFGMLHLIVTLGFVEPNVQTCTETTSVHHFVTAWRELMKNKKLKIFAFIQMLQKSIGFTSHRLEGAYFSGLVSLWLVNVARVLKQICGTISFLITPYIRKLGFYRILIGSTLGMTVIKIIALGMNNVATPFIQASVNLFYGASSTAGSALLQQELSPAQRATMGSIVSALGGIFAAIVYWVVGFIADVSSVYIAIMLLVLGNFAGAGGYYWLLKKYK